MWKREQAKEKGNAQKKDKENIAAIVDSVMGIVMMRALLISLSILILG